MINDIEIPFTMQILKAKNDITIILTVSVKKNHFNHTKSFQSVVQRGRE
jgi:hypothetical protein